MVWKLFRQLGLYGGTYAGFLPGPQDCSTLPLDPVTCIGVIKLKDLKGSVLHRRAVLGFCELAMNVLLTNDTSMWLDTSCKAAPKKDDRTADKWMEHISVLTTTVSREVPVKDKDTIRKLTDRWCILEADLLSYNPELHSFKKNVITGVSTVRIPWDPILLPATFGSLQHIGKYFAVPKTEDEARAIWNGRSLSTKSQTPPPVFLPYLPEMLRKISGLQKSFPDGMSMYTGDLRHFFHQIPAGHRLSSYFGVSFGGKFYRWRTLPMGWSWSPFCAQSIAWAILLYCPESILKNNNGKDPNFIIPEGLEKLPTYIELCDGGFICVYYDNYFVCGSEETVKRVAERIRSNCAHFSVEIKPGSEQLRTAHQMVTEPIVFLGAALRYVRLREGLVFSWNQCDKKLTKWRSLELCAGAELSGDVWGKTWTRRELQSVIGRVMWRRSLYHYPRSGTAPIVEILRRLATNNPGWDRRDFVLSESERSTMSESWTEVLLNPIHHACDFPQPTFNIVLATDSSDDGFGYVIYDHDGNIIQEIGEKWDEHYRNSKGGYEKWSVRHIYLKELKCALDTILMLSEKFPNTVFDLGIDNSAAAAAIRNMYSACVEACGWLDVFWATMQKRGCHVNVWGLRSEDNASDPASRRCYEPAGCAEPDLARRCFEHIVHARKGHYVGAYKPSESLRGKTGIRHKDVDDVHEVDPGTLAERLLDCI